MTVSKTFPLLALAASANIALSATAGHAAPAARSPIAETCRAVMGLQPGEAHFEGCLESLSSSLDGVRNDRALAAVRQACLDRGLKAGTPALAVCAVEGRGASATLIAAVDPAAAPRAAKSWPYAQNDERRQRERLACASLGLDPTGQAFDGCVAGLAATLFELDNPLN